MISSALVGIRTAYIAQYPRRNVGMINCLTHEKIDLGHGEWERRCLDDTGICFGVSMMVKDYLDLRFGLPSEIVYVYRRYDAEEGDGFEDILVHSVVYFDGKYYDTDDYQGVEQFSDLKYIAQFDGLGVRDHYACFPERADTGSRDSIPNKITDTLYQAIERIFTIEIPKRSIF